MKKILFVTPSELHGGTNKSLENLLNIIDGAEYQVCIYSIYRGGHYSDIFKNFQISQRKLLSCYFGRGRFASLIRRVDKIVFGSFFSDQIFKCEASYIQKKYKPDLLISFEEGMTTRLCQSFKNVKKIAWVHCDFRQYIKATNANIDREKKVYAGYSKIVCVSKATQKTMIYFFPEYKDKILYAYNTLNVDVITRLSNAKLSDVRFDTSNFTIVSVGRFDIVKRFDRIPEIVAEIKKNGIQKKFVWYIIAPIDERSKSEIESKIDKLQITENIVLLGSQANPYPYIKQANLLVCLSESESWSYVINEAKVLHTPVVTTDFDAAYEVVEDETGVITSFDKIDTILFDLIENNNNIYSKLETTTTKYNYNNEVAISQFNSIVSSII